MRREQASVFGCHSGTGAVAAPRFPVAALHPLVGRLWIGSHHLGRIRVVDDLPRVGRIIVPGDLIGIIVPVTVSLGDGCGVHDVSVVICRGEFRGIAARMLGIGDGARTRGVWPLPRVLPLGRRGDFLRV